MKTLPTRLGVSCALAGVLTILSSVSTGNNLLYLIYSQLVGLFLAGWVLGRRNIRGLKLDALDAPGAQRGKPARFPVRLLNDGLSPRLELRVPGAEAPVARLEAGGTAEVGVRATLPHRGLNRLAGVRVESLFPFGLWRHRGTGGEPVVLAVPQAPAGAWDPGEPGEGHRDGGRGQPGGPGDDFCGARPYDPYDDPRRINWKMTARTGSVFVNEYRAPGGGRRTVRLRPAADAERAVTEAAAACRAGIEAHEEVRLLTPEREVPYGRGPGHLKRLLEALALVGEGATPRPAKPDPASGAADLDELALCWTTRLGGVWVFCSLFLIQEMSRIALVALLPLLALGLVLERRGGPWVPKAVSDVCSLVVLVFAVGFDWRLSGVTVATSHLVAYVLLNRALTVFDRRHGLTFLSHFLAFFMVSGQTISLLYFVFFLGYAAYAALWLALQHGARWSERDAWLKPVGLAAAAALATGAAVFVATPRVEPRGQFNPATAIGLDRLKGQAQSVAGFTETVSLGFFGDIKRSSTKALRVAPVPPPARPGPVLVRGNAYESFDGNSWTKAPAVFLYRYRQGTYRAANGRAWGVRSGSSLRFTEPSATEQTYDMTIFPFNTAVLFSVGPLHAVELDSRVEAYMDHLDSGYFAVPYTAGVRYRVYADPNGSSIWPSILDSKSLRWRLLQLPAGLDPRVGALARRVTARLSTDAERVWAVRDHLRARYAYSTFSQDGKANLADFLFRTHRGNCEYFATAAAILLREAGIPTRLVTGFSAWDWNEYGRFYDVRQSQAHAWAEALVNGRWMTVDATPGDESLLRDFGDAFAKYFDALQARWYSSVIGYDRFAQRNTFYRMGQDLLRLPDLDWRRFLPAGAAGVALFFAWLAARRRRRDRGLFARAEAALARAGFARPPHETPLEFARALRESRPALAGLEDLARLHYRDRFGPGLSPDEKASAEALLASMDSILQSTAR